jgi:arylsulfatase A-like enzyme
MNHFSPSPEVLKIPWIAIGPGIEKGLFIDRPVRARDIAPTILTAFGLPVPDFMEGSAILEVSSMETAIAQQ